MITGSRSPRIAIIGAGIGGIAAAVLLSDSGFNVMLYEQAPRFKRLGAGIHLAPNAFHVLRKVGIEAGLLANGLQPDSWVSRDYKTGDIMHRLPLGESAQARWGAPYMTVHRGTLHELLISAIPSGSLRLGKQLVRAEEVDAEVKLTFTDGTTEFADIVIGADGLNSVIREEILGPELPTPTGYAAHRAVFRCSVSSESFAWDECAKWWGPEAHMLVYYLNAKRDQLYFVTGVPGGENWDMTKSFLSTTREQTRAHFADWHPTIQSVIDAAEEITLWPLFERKPLPLWSQGRQVLLGDACHPMKPHMGQGAAMALEDAAVLSRYIAECGIDHYETAFKLYQEARSPRATQVQQVSHDNTWLQYDEDPSWCFGYNAVSVALDNVY